MSSSAHGSIFSGQSAILTPTYKEQAYELIKEAIIYQRFIPNQVYSQDSICNELGISRTPVREALLELQKAGYIRFCRGRGIMILAVTVEEAWEIMEMRICNEQFAAGLATKRATADDLERIKSIFEEMRENIDSEDSTYLYKLDRGFHSRVVEASHNSWLIRLVEDLRDRFLCFENKTVFDQEDTGRAVLDEHERIYLAVYNRQEDEAKKAMWDHLAGIQLRTKDQFIR